MQDEDYNQDFSPKSFNSRSKKNERNQLQEKLDLITLLVSDSRADLKDKGFSFMLWGGVVSAGVLLTFFLRHIQLEKFILDFWLFFIVVSLAVNYHLARKRKVRSQVTKLSNVLWFSTVGSGQVLLLLAVFLPSYSTIDFLSVPVAVGFLCVLLGVGYLAHAVLSQYRFLYYVGLLWQLGGVFVMLLPEPYPYALVGGMAFLLQFIPGLYIYFIEK